jgi:hypothetical protein
MWNKCRQTETLHPVTSFYHLFECYFWPGHDFSQYSQICRISLCLMYFRGTLFPSRVRRTCALHMYLHHIHISNKEAFDDSAGYISTLSVLRPFMYTYRYEGFWIPLMYVWSEYRTYGTREYILTLFLLLACRTDFRIWIACDVPASCMAAIGSSVYLKQERKILSLLRYIALLPHTCFVIFHTYTQGWTTVQPTCLVLRDRESSTIEEKKFRVFVNIISHYLFFLFRHPYQKVDFQHYLLTCIRIGPIVWQMKKYYTESRRRGISYIQ